MFIRIFFFVFCVFMQFSAYTYELLSCKTTVSPGCEGGVLEQFADSYNEYTYRLTPHEAMNESTILFFNKQYLKPVRYKIFAQTILSGDINSSANDSNDVTIR